MKKQISQKKTKLQQGWPNRQLLSWTTLSTSKEEGRPVTGRPSWLSLEYSIPISDNLLVCLLLYLLHSIWLHRMSEEKASCFLLYSRLVLSFGRSYGWSDTSSCLAVHWFCPVLAIRLSSSSCVCPDWLAVYWHCTGCVLWQAALSLLRPDRPSTATSTASTDSWPPLEEGDI